MVTDQHRAFARAVVALARSCQIGAFRINFHHNFQAAKAPGVSMESVDVAWAEGRHGDTGSIEIQTRATETFSEKAPTPGTPADWDLRARIKDLETSVVAFCAPWAVEHAKAHGLPDGHIFAHHYDLLKDAGARMASFTRHDPNGGAP